MGERVKAIGRMLGGLLALVATLGMAAPAIAQDYCGTHDLPDRFYVDGFMKPMSFKVVDQPNGSKVLFVLGEIDDGSAARFAQALASAGVVHEVWLFSPGGSVDEGLEIGRQLRKSGLLVRIPNGAACISACTLAFLGGIVRAIEPDGYYGVHMFSTFFDEGSGASYITDMINRSKKYADAGGKGGLDEALRIQLMNSERRTAIVAAKIARYLVEMSASLEFLTGMFGQEQTGVCYLSRAGLTRYNVVNE